MGKLVNKTNGRDFIWIGLKDLEEDSNFKWIDGTPVDYLNWNGPDEPDGSGSCVQIFADHQKHKENQYKKWNDIYCDVRMRAYVCKKLAELKNNDKQGKLLLLFRKKFFSLPKRLDIL
jgi:collectin sub-family member 12